MVPRPYPALVPLDARTSSRHAQLLARSYHLKRVVTDNGVLSAADGGTRLMTGLRKSRLLQCYGTGGLPRGSTGDMGEGVCVMQYSGLTDARHHGSRRAEGSTLPEADVTGVWACLATSNVILDGEITLAIVRRSSSRSLLSSLVSPSEVPRRRAP